MAALWHARRTFHSGSGADTAVGGGQRVVSSGRGRGPLRGVVRWRPTGLSGLRGFGAAGARPGGAHLAAPAFLPVQGLYPLPGAARGLPRMRQDLAGAGALGGQRLGLLDADGGVCSDDVRLAAGGSCGPAGRRLRRPHLARPSPACPCRTVQGGFCDRAARRRGRDRQPQRPALCHAVS